jgi:hypothetical protein
MTRRWLASGLGVALIYLVVAWITWRSGTVPFRPVYDGLAPIPAYRWVNPPPEFAADNEPPFPGMTSLHIGPDGTDAATLTVSDAQATVVLREASFEPSGAADTVRVDIIPLDPATIGPPPAGLRLDGNAYRVEAVYLPGSRPAELSQPAHVFLRYPIHATSLLRWGGTSWEPLTTNVIPGNAQVWGETDELGVFVPAVEEGASPPPAPGSGGPSVVVILISVAASVVAAALALWLTGRRGAPSRPSRPGKKRPVKGGRRG